MTNKTKDEEAISSHILKTLPTIALPEGAHLFEKGHISFLMEEEGKLKHMVSCFR